MPRGDYSLDLSLVIENRDHALQLAGATGQLAIWDLGTASEVRTGYSEHAARRIQEQIMDSYTAALFRRLVRWAAGTLTPSDLI